MNDLYRFTDLRHRCRPVLPLRKLAGVAAVLVLCLPLPIQTDVQAQSLKADFTIREWLEYDDNTLLSKDDPKDIVGSTTSPQVTISAETQTMTSELSARVDLRRHDDSQFDSTDLHLDWNNEHRGELTTLKLGAAVDLDTARTSELDSGVRIVSGVDRRRVNVSPGVEYSLTPVDFVDVSGSYTRTTYSSDDGNDFTDYQTISINPSFSHSFGPRDTGYVTLLMDRYETIEGTLVEIDSVGPVAGWNHRWNEMIDFGGYLGWRLSFTDVAGQSTDTSNGLSARFFWNYQDETDRINLRASQAITPQSNGTQVRASTVGGSWVHRINERFSTQLDTYVRHNSNLDGDQGNESTYFQFWPRLRYSLTEEWDLSPSYRYRTISRSDDNDADSHAFLVNISYDLDPVDLN